MSSWQIVEIEGREGGNPLTAGFTAVLVDAADITDSLDAANEPKGQDENRRTWGELRGKVTGSPYNQSWYGLPNRSQEPIADQVRHILRDGWPEGVDMLNRISGKVTADFPPPVSMRRRGLWADEGLELDGDRYYAGRFEDCWRDSRRQASFTQQVISIAVPWGATSNYSAKQLQYNGLAVMLLADLLDTAGYETEIAACSGVTEFGCRTFRHITVKRAGEALQLDTLAAVVAHPAVFRCFGIPMNTQSRFSMAMTGATDLPHKYLTRLENEGAIPACDVVLGNSYSEDEAIHNVRAALEQLAGVGAIQL